MRIPIGHEEILSSLQRALAYAENNGYAGYSKFDALNSPLLHGLTLGIPVLRLLITQALMRSPVNLRPFFGVRKSINPKGMALFAMAYLNLCSAGFAEDAESKARRCLDWLAENHSTGYAGPCWGYNFGWQSPGFYAPPYMPNLVVTSVVGQAMVKGCEILGEGRYLKLARGAAEFILTDLEVLDQTETSKCIAYVPAKSTIRVLNVNAQAAALLARIFEQNGEERLREEAEQLLRYAAERMTEYGGWYYTDPPGASPITHDNYHTGNVLDSFIDYAEATDDRQFDKYLDKGLEFYRSALFREDGAPKFMNNRIYPLDIHGAAQSIVTLCKASKRQPLCLEEACRTAAWAVREMQNPTDGRFYYQKRRYFTLRFCLMRWNQAWMSRALSRLYLLLQRDHSHEFK